MLAQTGLTLHCVDLQRHNKYRIDGHVVTKSDRLVSSGHSGFLQHEDQPNANIGANEHD